jgi:hypothetical protein
MRAIDPKHAFPSWTGNGRSASESCRRRYGHDAPGRPSREEVANASVRALSGLKRWVFEHHTSTELLFTYTMGAIDHDRSPSPFITSSSRGRRPSAPTTRKIIQPRVRLDDAVEAKAADRGGALIRTRQPRRQPGAIDGSDRDRDQKEGDLHQKQPSVALQLR